MVDTRKPSGKSTEVTGMRVFPHIAPVLVSHIKTFMSVLPVILILHYTLNAACHEACYLDPGKPESLCPEDFHVTGN